MKANKAVLAAAVAAVFAGSGVAYAAPLLQILDSAGSLAGAANREVTGDAGGTAKGQANPSGGGIPSANGGWAVGPGFAADPSFNNAQGTSGWHGSYLYLADSVAPSAYVTFTFVGKGNSTLANTFWVDSGSGFTKLFDPYTGSAACPGGPVNNCVTYGYELKANQYVPFKFVTGNGVTLQNNVAGGNPDTASGNSPGYFLGVDPYLAAGPFQNTGTIVYAGLTDLPSTGDHDFQDLGVRITVQPVPEPGTWALLVAGLGLFGLTAMRRVRSF